MTLYFNIPRRPNLEIHFLRDTNVDITMSINGPTILVNFASDKQNLDRITMGARNINA